MPDTLYQVRCTEPGEFLELEAGNDGLIFRKELIYKGDFVKSTKEGEQPFSIDEKKIQHWCTYGNKMLRNGVKVPVPIKHTTDPEMNRASVLRYETGVNANGLPALFGILKFRDAKAAELAASTDVSIFVPTDNFVDGKGNVYPYVIKHVALTDYPVIPGLEDFEAIAASHDDTLILTSVDPTATKGQHLATAAVHGGLGLLEYHHAKHIGKGLAKTLGRHFAKGGVKAVAKKVVATGAKVGLTHYAIPVALGALAAHGVLHSGMTAIKSLSKVPKAPKSPTALSLEFKNTEARDADGRWSRLGRAAAAAGIGGLATAAGLKAVGGPLALKASRHLAKASGVALKAMTTKEKAAVAVESAAHIANSVGLGALAKRVAQKPSDKVKEQSKFKHRLKSLGYGGGAAYLGLHAANQGHKAIQTGKLTHHLAKVSEDIYRTNDKSKAVRVGAHALLTRPAALLTAASAAGAIGLGYAASRALRKSKMHKEAIAASLELSEVVLVDDPSHPNIKARQGGRFVSVPGGGHQSVRELRKLRRAKGEHHYIRDESREDVHYRDRVTHGLQALKHASLGIIEGGLAAAAITGAANAAGVKFSKILTAPLRGAAGARSRTNALKGTAAGLAAAAAATGLFHSRLDAIHTHLQGALGHKSINRGETRRVVREAVGQALKDHAG